MTFEPESPLWHKKQVPASWLQLSLKAPSAALDAISNFLIERGSPGVVLKRNEVRAFFEQSGRNAALKRDVHRFLKEIRGIYPNIAKEPLRWSILRDKNWNSSWRRFFSPQKIGRGLWVTPPWIAPPFSSGRKLITIEPGMAFGTGTHATTRGCLEFLEEVTALLPPQDITALDVGTGSGILAIALAKMGASKVLALDNDPVAVKAARSNVRRNRVEKTVKLALCSLGRIKGSFTIVVANLTAETIIHLADALQEKVSPKGYLILSGILKPTADEVLRQYCPGSFTLVRQKNLKDWSTLLLRKRG